eukprot:gb/GECH01012907.1/.p1 GENE.gb/GECH01012907.1/~~gb/GECH01012907.1/.p1  ORF type:complete len:1026 (+),score=213.10 gb/GECH01012907.1/:1-3078(+)
MVTNQLYGFHQKTSFDYNGTPVSKYVSQRTGMQVVLSQVAGPCVNLYGALATEAHDDDGCPHVLEHLIFLGSEDYPYKGVLDKAANCCFAQGTNAWTDTDHTCYTLTTAGENGLLHMLPMYLDHILFPTLTDDGFVTEVHHVNGEAEDGGVVYCEMQARENTGISRTMLELQRLLFHEDCGYRYETGGLCSNLRSLTAQKVRDYHRAFYRPDNLAVVVTGQVSPDRLLRTIAAFEEKIPTPNHHHHPRPWWGSSLPDLQASRDAEVEFPSDDDQEGAMCHVAWMGPSWDDMETRTALTVLWSYLADSAVSPLQKAFVERDDPYCGRVSVGELEHSRIVPLLHFSGVRTERLSLLEDLLMQTLREEVSRGIDMERMKAQLRRLRLGHASETEEDPHTTIALAAIGDFLYGKEPHQLESLLRDEDRFKQLESWSAEQWENLLHRTLIDPPHVTVRGRPSSSLAERLQKEERDRIDKQAKDIGEDRLKELGQEVDAAAERNDVEVPEDMIPVPDVGELSPIPVITHRSDGSYTSDQPEGTQLKEYVSQHGEPPVFAQFDHINSHFAEVHAYLDTSTLPEHLRPYIELYLESVFESAIERDGKVVPYDEVVRQLQAESVSTANGCGMTSRNFVAGSFSSLLWISLKFENTDYERMMQWLRELLWQTRFDAERLSIAASKLINDVARARRDASTVTRSALKYINFDAQRSNHAACNFQRQHDFLLNVQRRLEDEPSSVLEEIESFRRHVTDPSRLRLHIAGGLLSLGSRLSKAVNTDFLATAPARPSQPCTSQVPFIQQLLTSAMDSSNDKNDASPSHGAVFGLASTDSSYMQRTVPGINRYDDEDGPAMMVAVEYLTALEGPMWRQIRGQGLSYAYGIHTAPEEGLTYFTLFKSGNLPKAYAETQSILEEHTQPDDFDEVEVKAARSASTFQLISREETMWEAASQRFLNFLRRVPSNHNFRSLSAVQSVNRQDVCRVVQKYLAPLFSADKTNTVVTTNPNKVDEIARVFENEYHQKLEKASLDNFFRK